MCHKEFQSKRCLLLRVANRINAVKQRAIIFVLAVLTSLFPFSAYADIYSCPTPDGGKVFTDQPCDADGGVTVYKETEADRRRQLQYKLERERSAQEAETKRRLRQVLDLLWAGRNDDARELAVKYGWGDKLGEIDAMFQEEVIQRQNQKIAEQNAQLQYQQRRAMEAEAAAEAAAADAKAAERRAAAHHSAPAPSPSHPKYVPSTGQWCQDLGGTMNCW